MVEKAGTQFRPVTLSLSLSQQISCPTLFRRKANQNGEKIHYHRAVDCDQSWLDTGRKGY